MKTVEALEAAQVLEFSIRDPRVVEPKRLQVGETADVSEAGIRHMLVIEINGPEVRQSCSVLLAQCGDDEIV